MRLSSTSHSPSLLPSPPPPHLPPAAAAAAALRRARTPQCKDCSSITFGARQGLVFRGQRANFSDGYIVQLDSVDGTRKMYPGSNIITCLCAYSEHWEYYVVALGA